MREAARESQGELNRPVVLKPGRVWDGVALDAHSDWIVVVQGETIKAAGPAGTVEVPGNAQTLDLAGHDPLARADRCSYACLASSLR